MPAEDTALLLVQQLERSMGDRLTAHSKRLLDQDAELGEMRSDLGRALGRVDDRLANVEKQQAVANTLMEAGQKRMNGVIAVGIGVAITILASACGVIFFGTHP